MSQITVTPTPPVTPPCTVEICVPAAGVLTLKWAHEPFEMEFTKGELSGSSTSRRAARDS